MNDSSRLSGFTIIEVVLVLAITGFLSATIMAGVQGSINNQRYNDTVNSFKDYLQNQYFQVANVNIQNRVSRGRTEYVVIGRLLVFTPEKDFMSGDMTRVVDSYDVIGKVPSQRQDFDKIGTNDTDFLSNADTDLKVDPNSKSTYALEWDATATTSNVANASRNLILIARSPLSGSIRTYTIDNPDVGFSILTKLSQIVDSDFLKKGSTFCLIPNGFNTVVKRAVIIRANGSNASAVELAPTDTKVNGVEPVKCQ